MKYAIGFLITSLLVLCTIPLAFFIVNKPTVVGVTVGDGGSSALFDTPCTLGPKGFHLELYNVDKSFDEVGCWLLEDNMLFVFSPKRGPGTFPADVVTWKN